MLSSRRPFHVVVAAALMLTFAFSSTQLAAQSIMPKSNATSPDRGDPRGRRPDAPDYRQYEYGKELYAVKLACSSCPLADKPLDETVAKRFFVDETLWEPLNDKEYDAVSTYLRQRFGLPGPG